MDVEIRGPARPLKPGKTTWVIERTSDLTNGCRSISPAESRISGVGGEWKQDCHSRHQQNCPPCDFEHVSLRIRCRLAIFDHVSPLHAKSRFQLPFQAEKRRLAAAECTYSALARSLHGR
jgi:hypothetical protein